MQADLIESYGTDLSVVNAARVSFAGESSWVEYELQNRDGGTDAFKILSSKDKKLIKYLADHKHTSCFEHQGATLRIKVPIFIARQIHRHRLFSYNEVSRRYTTEDIEFYWPEKWRKAADNVKQGSSDEELTQIDTDEPLAINPHALMGGVAKAAMAAYNTAVAGGMAPEQARMVLPQNMYTTFYMTGNLRSFHHFLKLRQDSHSQVEMQEIATQIDKILRPLWPVSMEALLPS